MILLEELRINNWVSVDGKICQLTTDVLKEILSTGTQQNVEGILLDKQILENAGFLGEIWMNHITDHPLIGKVSLVISPKNGWISIQQEIEGGLDFEQLKDLLVELHEKGDDLNNFSFVLKENDIVPFPCMFVHELQNLWFSLTREELDFSSLSSSKGEKTNV